MLPLHQDVGRQFSTWVSLLSANLPSRGTSCPLVSDSTVERRLYSGKPWKTERAEGSLLLIEDNRNNVSFRAKDRHAHGPVKNIRAPLAQGPSAGMQPHCIHSSHEPLSRSSSPPPRTFVGGGASRI